MNKNYYYFLFYCCWWMFPSSLGQYIYIYMLYITKEQIGVHKRCIRAPLLPT